MSVASVSTITASSKESWQDALRQGLERARRTLRGITSVEVLTERARVREGAILAYEVELKIIFELDN
ncbi:MAG: dodecin family protein [Myxococcota bacterium]